MNIGIFLIPLFGIFCYILGLTLGMRKVRKDLIPIIEDQIDMINNALDRIEQLRSKNVTSSTNS